MINALGPPGSLPFRADRIGITVGRDPAVGGSQNPGRRIENAGQLVERNVTDPFVSIVAAGFRQAAIARGPDWNLGRGLVADVAVHVRVDKVLTGGVKGRKRLPELLPVLRRIHFKKRIMDSVVQRPAQCQLAGLARLQLADNRTVPGEDHIERDVRLALHMDHFLTMFRSFPPLRSLILPRGIEGLDVGVFHRRTDIGASPGDALVVPDDHIGQTRQGHPGDIEVPGAQMGFIPQVGHLVTKMHVVR